MPNIMQDLGTKIGSEFKTHRLRIEAVETDKQENLVSGTNIKTINGTSVLGPGDIVTTQTTISGNAGTATKLATARTISLAGDVTGNVSFDGSADVTLAVSVADDSHNHAFGNLTGKPTTVAGYGITDVYTKAQTDSTISTAVAGLVNGAPATLDTLNELAAALGNDANFAATTSTALGNRVIKNADIVAGTGTKVTYDTKGLVTGSSTPTTLAGYSIGDAYTKTELNNGQLDSRYYTEAEVDTALALKVDDTEIASVNLLRADKYLAAQAVANMVYSVEGKLSKVQYNNATDVDYEVLTYNGSGKLSNVAHYTTSILRGNTVLSYSAGKLVSAIYTGV